MTDDIERRVLARLGELGVDYRPLRIDPAHAATADFSREYGWALEQSANCLLVVGRSDPPRHAACVVDATRQADVNRTVRRWLGVRKASFASADDVEALTGMTPHGVTPFGLPSEIPVLVDAVLMDQPEVVVGGGSRALKLVVAPSALAGLAQAEVVERLSRALPSDDPAA